MNFTPFAQFIAERVQSSMKTENAKATAKT
jgi:hypothetical protein